MREKFLQFSPPSIGDGERSEVLDTLMSDWITTGPKTRLFEGNLKAYLGAPDLAAFNSCTAGLHVGLAVLGVGPGDEVIVPSLTFCATANVVEHVGARPVLVDVDPATLTLDPQATARALTSRTKAIMPVHYAGHPAQLDPLFDLAGKHGLHILEDAAHALPARYKGRLVGSRGNLASFSFYATKNLTTAEGGALTGDPELLAKARIIGHHGMDKEAWKRFDRSGSWYYEVLLPGFKYNMTDLQAAIGLHQLVRLEAFQARRRQVVDRYNARFALLPELQIPVEDPDVESSLHLYVLRLRPERLTLGRNEFIEALKARQIGTSVHYLPVHMQPFYRDKYGYRPEDCPVSADAFSRMLSLPLHPGLTDADVDDVCTAMEELVAAHRA
ncbi:DegT/DnrJ/EryC1/StrS family aminotransferase [Mesoterricola silvestris]|uniref:Spore coat polysaccharide biosynthesis protein SpsC n=1 Tax=Mesoterricola silvestris TaxID=2927979 RepID=A0AA48GPT9_9BACT|nr:DegT/DnrJ/EryC1/StrS family aminotransferase [Mesoterricola silvestris]BDU71777.1 spore coat polysaccharide biosynthesis protein SpsC [Mesoterricola silvestris]